jgi:hypothetical protein
MATLGKHNKLLNMEWKHWLAPPSKPPLAESKNNIQLPKKIGVYVIAWERVEEKLEGRKVGDTLGKVFYVGMTNSKLGLKGRLTDFINGLQTGKSHSAAMRFHRFNNKNHSNHYDDFANNVDEFFDKDPTYIIENFSRSNSDVGFSFFEDSPNNLSQSAGRHFYLAFFTPEKSVERDRRCRSSDDLIEMGKIAFLEMEMLAIVRQKAGNEPRLNKK